MADEDSTLQENVQFLKEIINKSFLKEEQDIYYAGLKLIGLTIEQQFNIHVPIIKKSEYDYKIDITNIPSLDFSKQLIQKFESFTEEQGNTYIQFQFLTYRLHYLLIQKLRADKEYNHAMAQAEYIVDYLNKMRKRIMPEPLPAEYAEIKSLFEDEIKEIKSEHTLIDKSETDIPVLKEYKQTTIVKGSKKLEPYFIDSIERAETLHECLINTNPPLIDNYSAFIESFCNQHIHPITITVWRGTITELFYLLYLLYGKQDEYKNIPIYKIAYKLFRFSDKKATPYILKKSYKKFIDRINGQYSNLYIESKFKRITEIYHTLFPNK